MIASQFRRTGGVELRVGDDQPDPVITSATLINLLLPGVPEFPRHPVTGPGSPVLQDAHGGRG